MLYHEVLERNAALLGPMVKPGDIVLLHDPQPPAWPGASASGSPRRLALPHRPGHADRADRPGLGLPAPPHRGRGCLHLLPPGLRPGLGARRPAVGDPAVPRPVQRQERELSPADVDGALHEAALKNTNPDHGSLTFTRRNGSTGTVRGHRRLMVDGPPMPRGARFVLQVSRWDHLKDMAGVLMGVAGHLDDLPVTSTCCLPARTSRVSPTTPRAPRCSRSAGVCGARPRRPAPRAPRLPPHGRRRRERPPRQRPPAPGRRRRAEEPGRRIRPHRHRADVEGQARARQRCRGGSRTRSSTARAGCCCRTRRTSTPSRPCSWTCSWTRSTPGCSGPGPRPCA